MTTSPTPDRWQEAYEELRHRIRQHREFPALVRAVAVADSPRMPGLRWLQRNSRTNGSWAIRQADRSVDDSRDTRRARFFSIRIAGDLWPDLELGSSQFRERAAMVFVTARECVNARCRGVEDLQERGRRP